MEEKREERLLADDTGMYKEPQLDSVFMTAIDEVYSALKEAGFEPYDQLTRYVRTGNDLYITRKRNARKIVSDLNPELIKRYLKRYGNMHVIKNEQSE